MKFSRRGNFVFKILSSLTLIVALLIAPGCLSTLENINDHSTSEGVTEDVAGEAESNPYSRITSA